ncbi:MAG: glycosyltransferase family 1 protein [Anaerolineae bacterium]|nr:glycosyltransferase family 1 protein [Anaerolineae bacterium]
MQVTILAVGTRGDVQPLVALAKGLHGAGHTVCVATTHEFETPVREQGLSFFALSGSPSRMMQDAGLLAAMGGNRNPVTLVRGILDAMEPLFEQGVAEAWTACQGADAVIVSMLGFYAGCHVAEKLGIPCIEGCVLPARPTRAFSSPLLGVNLHLGGNANRLSHVILLQFAWLLLQPVTNRARRAVLGLHPLSFRALFREFEREQQPVLHGYSPLVLPKPSDWHAWHHVTGYWFLDHSPSWQPPGDLVDFLEAGPPPVCVGFGSMTGRDPERVTEAVLAALKRTGQRGLLLTGWGGIDASGLSGDVFKLDSAPHDWLFPHMAAVVHHGGSGTTAAGLRAGVPSILVPFGGDQFLWGQCVKTLGVGPEPIPRQQLTAEKLAYAIRVAVEHGPIRARASALGERIRAEDGVRNAVQIIERYLAHPRVE